MDFTGHHMSTTTADKVTCYLPSLCTAIECCVEVTPLSRSFHLYLNIDPCNYLLRVGIDIFYLNQSLDRYTFGKALRGALYFMVSNDVLVLLNLR